MTARRLTARRNVLDNRKDEVIAALVAGDSWSQAAGKFGVTKQAIGFFIARHEDEIRAMQGKVAKAVEDFAIASKVNRIAALDDRWQRGKALIQARATDDRYSDEPGYETGLMVHQIKGVGKGDDFQLIDLYVTDNGLLSELRAIERAAAEELAQLPRSPDAVQVNVAVGVQLVWQDGEQA